MYDREQQFALLSSSQTLRNSSTSLEDQAKKNYTLFTEAKIVLERMRDESGRANNQIVESGDNLSRFFSELTKESTRMYSEVVRMSKTFDEYLTWQTDFQSTKAFSKISQEKFKLTLRSELKYILQPILEHIKAESAISSGAAAHLLDFVVTNASKDFSIRMVANFNSNSNTVSKSFRNECDATESTRADDIDASESASTN